MILIASCAPVDMEGDSMKTAPDYLGALMSVTLKGFADNKRVGDLKWGAQKEMKSRRRVKKGWGMGFQAQKQDTKDETLFLLNRVG